MLISVSRRAGSHRGLEAFAGTVRRVATLTMQCAVHSDVGRRENNEDAVFATPRMAAVADGVGGAKAGEVASALVIDAMVALEKRRLSGALSEELRAAVLDANQRLGFVVSCRPHLAGMASTLTTVALSNDGEYLIANVGDSRTYLFREGVLRQLTRDQSLIQMLIESGAITEAEARVHPQRSVVLQALDGSEDRAPSITRCTAKAGDRLLLCSDGLSDVLSPEEISDVLRGGSRQAAVSELIAAALRAGARDNISAIVADVVPADDPGAGWLAMLPPPRTP